MKGGMGKGKHSYETIEKMRIAHKGKSRKPHSEQTKQLFSEMRKGKPAHNKGKPGKPMTKEQKNKISHRLKGKPTHNRFKGTKGEMYAIRKQKNRYQIIVTNQFLGSFKTLDEAKTVRDEFIKNILESENKLDKQE
jgi:hypothetical protein